MRRRLRNNGAAHAFETRQHRHAESGATEAVRHHLDSGRPGKLANGGNGRRVIIFRDLVTTESIVRGWHQDAGTVIQQPDIETGRVQVLG